MKILIIATARSGSTNLLNVLSSLFNLKRFAEPWNKSYIGEPYDFHQPHIVKELIHHFENWDTVSNYDYVIYLTRRDIKSATESWCYQFCNHNDSPSKWHENYFLTKSTDLPEDMIIDCEKWMTDNTELIRTKSTNIVDYEDLYSNNIDLVTEIFTRWGFNRSLANDFFTNLNKRGRYRREHHSAI